MTSDVVGGGSCSRKGYGMLCPVFPEKKRRVGPTNSFPNSVEFVFLTVEVCNIAVEEKPRDFIRVLRFLVYLS